MQDNPQTQTPPTTTQPPQPEGEPPIQPPSQPTTPQSSAGKPWLKPVATLVALLILGAAAFLFYQNQQLRQQLSQPQQTAVTPSPSPEATGPGFSDLPQNTPDPTANWETFSLETLNLKFKLPPELDKFGQLDEKTIAGEKGNQLCITYGQTGLRLVPQVYAGGGPCSINTFGFGTTSKDYEAGRSAGFADLQGFRAQGNKFFIILNSEKSFELPSGIAQEISNPNKVKILVVSSDPDAENTLVPWAIPEKTIGAIINIPTSSSYRGVTILMNLDNDLTENLFDQILSTFQFIN